MSDLYLRIYTQQAEVAQTVLRKEGREKLQQMYNYYAAQLHKYGIAAQSPPQQGGFLQRIARGLGGSQAKKLQPRVEAYADVLKADAEAAASVAKMTKNIASSMPKCPKCGDQWLKSLPEGHLENCDGKNSTERRKEIDSKKDGLLTEYHHTGEKFSEETWVAGKKEGIFRQWSQSGQLSLEMTYVNDKKEGRFRDWWEDGTLKSDFIYVNDKPDGLMRCWNPDGSLSSESRWSNGSPLD